MTADKRDNLFGYSVRLTQIAEADGGGWLAEVPELSGCMSNGETPEDALANAKEAVECWLAAASEDGITPPQPKYYEDDVYSGKFTLRLPKSLHKTLSKQAEREDTSLNQLVLSMISFALGVDWSKLEQASQQPSPLWHVQE